MADREVVVPSAERLVVDVDIRAAFGEVSTAPSTVRFVEELAPEFFVDAAAMLDAEAGAIVAELVIAAFSAAAFSAAALRSGLGAFAGRSGIGSGIGSDASPFAATSPFAAGVTFDFVADFAGGLSAVTNAATAATLAGFGFAATLVDSIWMDSVGMVVSGFITGADFTEEPVEGDAAWVPVLAFAAGEVDFVAADTLGEDTVGVTFAAAGFDDTAAFADFAGAFDFAGVVVFVVGFAAEPGAAFIGAAFWVFATSITPLNHLPAHDALWRADVCPHTAPRSALHPDRSSNCRVPG